MIPPEAILRFADRQKKLLRKTYDEAWQRGVDGYEPDTDPSPSQSTLPSALRITGLAGAALLAARRDQPYAPPVHPDPVRRVVALYPSYNGINRMVGELTTISSGPGVTLASIQTDSGPALADWASTNAWRLDAGDSVAWAGEQAGFAEAADTDGQFLYGWMSVGDTHVCSDCELLTGFPPMPLGEWPTSPGAGDTACGPGCRCTWDTWDLPLPANYVPTLSSDQQDLIDNLSARQLEAINAMMPDVAYLEG